MLRPMAPSGERRDVGHTGASHPRRRALAAARARPLARLVGAAHTPQTTSHPPLGPAWAPLIREANLPARPGRVSPGTCTFWERGHPGNGRFHALSTFPHHETRTATDSSHRTVTLSMVLHETILGTIGKTPHVRLQRMFANDKGVQVWMKPESFNPGGSIKDRVALSMIEVVLGKAVG